MLKGLLITVIFFVIAYNILSGSDSLDVKEGVYGTIDRSPERVKEMARGCEAGDLNLCVLRAWVEDGGRDAKLAWYEKGCSDKFSRGCSDAQPLTNFSPEWYLRECKEGGERGCAQYAESLVKKGASQEEVKTYYRLGCVDPKRWSACRDLNEDYLDKSKRRKLAEKRKQHQRLTQAYRSFLLRYWVLRKSGQTRVGDLQEFYQLIESTFDIKKYYPEILNQTKEGIFKSYLTSDKATFPGVDQMLGTSDDIVVWTPFECVVFEFADIEGVHERHQRAAKLERRRCGWPR